MSEERAKSSKTENQHIVMSEIDETTDSNISVLFRSMMTCAGRNVKKAESSGGRVRMKSVGSMISFQHYLTF